MEKSLLAHFATVLEMMGEITNLCRTNPFGVSFCICLDMAHEGNLKALPAMLKEMVRLWETLPDEAQIHEDKETAELTQQIANLLRVMINEKYTDIRLNEAFLRNAKPLIEKYKEAKKDFDLPY